MISKTYYSQYKQDKFVNEVVFKGKRNGFFIDIGAHDGVSLSNTFYFEKYKGWTGICFEPNPSTFISLEKNRNCIVVNKCIGESDFEIKFCKVNGPSNMLSGIFDSYTQVHFERVKNEVELFGGSIELISVPMVKLELYLNEKRTIDFLSIDTEGNELSILQSIDFSKNLISCISVENNYNNPNIISVLTQNGFRLLTRLGVDEVYLNKVDYSIGVAFRLKCWILKRKLTNGFLKLKKVLKS